MATYYITNHGNDENNGLTLKTSWKTFDKMNKILSNNHTFYIEGTLYTFKNISYTYYRIINGLNSAKLDGKMTYMPARINCSLNNIEIFNYDRFCEYNTRPMYNCYFHDIHNFYTAYNTGAANISYCIFYNVGNISLPALKTFSNNTLHLCNRIYVHQYNSTYGHVLYNSIFSNSTIAVINPTNFSNCLFINCSFRFYGGGLGHDEAEYTYPAGTSGDEKLQNLKDRMSTVYGTFFTDYLIDCVYYTGSYNDIFVDADNNNFYLVPNSIAEYMSDTKHYIGAKMSNPATDLTNFTLTNVGTNGEIINDNLNSSIISNIINFSKVVKINSFKNISRLFYEQGTQLNLDDTLGPEIYEGHDVLTDQIKYMSFNDSVFVDVPYVNTYVEHKTFIASAVTPIINEYGTSGNGLGFKTYNNLNGHVKEVYYNKTLEKFKIKCSKNDSNLTNSVELLMYINEVPKVNIDRYGNPIIGNADPNFNESTSVDLYVKYIQYIVEIKAHNIPNI